LCSGRDFRAFGACENRVLDGIDPDVFIGRNPAWRQAWENLDARARMEVANAVKEGVRVSDPGLEPFVYGLIARGRSRHRWGLVLAVLSLGQGVFWVIATTVIRPSAFKWLWIVAVATEVAVIPFLIRADSQRLNKAEAAQTSPRGDISKPDSGSV